MRTEYPIYSCPHLPVKIEHVFHDLDAVVPKDCFCLFLFCLFFVCLFFFFRFSLAFVGQTALLCEI